MEFVNPEICYIQHMAVTKNDSLLNSRASCGGLNIWSAEKEKLGNHFGDGNRKQKKIFGAKTTKSMR